MSKRRRSSVGKSVGAYALGNRTVAGPRFATRPELRSLSSWERHLRLIPICRAEWGPLRGMTQVGARFQKYLMTCNIESVFVISKCYCLFDAQQLQPKDLVGLASSCSLLYDFAPFCTISAPQFFLCPSYSTIHHN